jgi:NAD(P) transhydrogenase subunit beta
VPDSPIFGMPILDVDKSGSVIVLKRSMASGFAGIDNPLFYDPKTAMLFGDAKKSVSEIVSEVQAL